MVKTKVINGKHNKSFLSFETPSCKYNGVKDCVKYKPEDPNFAVHVPGTITTIYCFKKNFIKFNQNICIKSMFDRQIKTFLVTIVLLKILSNTCIVLHWFIRIRIISWATCIVPPLTGASMDHPILLHRLFKIQVDFFFTQMINAIFLLFTLLI